MSKLMAPDTDTSERDALAANLVAHSLTYSFLGRVFYEPPDTVLISTLAVNRLFDDWPLDSDQPGTQTGLAMLRQFCESWDESQLEALKRDYTRLFVGPDKLLAPPWESVYRSPDHLIFEEQTLQVRQAYRRFSMEPPNPGVEPEDHIGLELRFIAHLCNLGLNAMEHNRMDQVHTATDAIRAFLDSHLGRWSDDFSQRVIEKARTDYYRGMAKLLRGCVSTSKKAFNIPKG